MEQKIDKSIVSRAIVSKLEDERSPKEIKTNHIVGFKSPARVSLQNKDKSYVPDIAAIYENETIVYEIELNKKMHVNKWRAFSQYVKNNNGSFYLVVPNNLKEHVKKELEEKQVNAGVITFATE